eukprot:1796409-Amphidinium_carterae.1
MVLCGEYIDDLPTVDVSILTDSTTSTFHRLMAMLGWELSSKTSSFGEEMEALGVMISFAHIRHGLIVVSNKTSRVDEITSTALKLIAEGVADRRTL